jgi:hypothetical protein
MPAPSATVHEHLPLIVVTETWLLDVLLADAAIKPHIIRLDARSAAVAPDMLAVVLARLRALGHTPKIVAE